MEGFAGRLAYVRWLQAMGADDPETDRALADRAGVTRAWLTKWLRRSDAPTDRTMTRLLCEALAVSDAWLLDGAGEPPHPELWARWTRAARQARKLPPVVETHFVPVTRETKRRKAR